jgi:hypothetical protein
MNGCTFCEKVHKTCNKWCIDTNSKPPKITCANCMHGLIYHKFMEGIEADKVKENAEIYLYGKVLNSSTKLFIIVSNLTGVMKILPQELHLKILSYLDISTLCLKLGIVNKYWHNLTDSDVVWQLRTINNKKDEKKLNSETFKEFYKRVNICEHGNFHDTRMNCEFGAYSTTRYYYCLKCDKLLWTYSCDAWENDTTNIFDKQWWAKFNST